jgi:hypothetical protein
MTKGTALRLLVLVLFTPLLSGCLPDWLKKLPFGIGLITLKTKSSKCDAADVDTYSFHAYAGHLVFWRIKNKCDDEDPLDVTLSGFKNKATNIAYQFPCLNSNSSSTNTVTAKVAKGETKWVACGLKGAAAQSRIKYAVQVGGWPAHDPEIEVDDPSGMRGKGIQPSPPPSPSPSPRP